MKVRFAGCAVAAGLILGLSLAPAFAASPVSIRNLYNIADNAFSSLQSVATDHNSFARRSHPNCSTERRKWWTKRARQNDGQAKTVVKRLMRATRAQRKTRPYRDMLKAAHDLVHWVQTQIAPKFATCKRMPTGNGVVQQDLTAVVNDLGIQKY